MNYTSFIRLDVNLPAREPIAHRFLEGLPSRFSPAEGDTRMNCVLIDVDAASGKASAISRLCLRIDG